MVGFIRRYAALHHVSRRLVSNAVLLYDPTAIAQARGVVVAGSLPLEPTAAEAAYAMSFEKAFPAIPPAVPSTRPPSRTATASKLC